MRKYTLTIVILGLAGLAVSTYLFYLYSQPTPIQCVTGCEEVRQSEYSKFLGIDVPILGMLYYLSVVLGTVIIYKNYFGRYSSLVEFALSSIITLGLFFSIYLSFLEEFVIGAWCQWCIVSASVSVLIFATWVIRSHKLSQIQS